jgi:hypothetical protein
VERAGEDLQHRTGSTAQTLGNQILVSPNLGDGTNEGELHLPDPVVSGIAYVQGTVWADDRGSDLTEPGFGGRPRVPEISGLPGPARVVMMPSVSTMRMRPLGALRDRRRVDDVREEHRREDAGRGKPVAQVWLRHTGR